MSKTGLVFDIQRFSVNDGPGIRTTVFLKGCSLRCSWCHNPESIGHGPQLVYDRKKCTLCGRCVAFTDDNSIQIVEGTLTINFEINHLRYELANQCPNKALRICGKSYTSEEIMEIIRKDKKYYEESGGGVTLSGGDPLNQMVFAQELLKQLKSEGIHTCFDASGYNPKGHLSQLIDYVDVFLLDFKMEPSEQMAQYVGKVFDLGPVLDLFETNKSSVILRCPIIPGVNDTASHFQRMAEFSKTYDCIQYMELLPYHALRKDQQFKRYNTYRQFPVAAEDQKQQWIACLAANGAKEVRMDSRIHLPN